jgi:hypothetical protein
VSQPAEAGAGSSPRSVFAADPAVVSKCVKEPKKIGIVHFAFFGLVAVWNTCDLDVTDASNLLAKFDAQIAFNDLRVVEVELNAQIRRSILLANRLRLALPLEEIPWHVAAIDRFDKNRDPLRSSLSRRPRYVLYIDRTVHSAKESRLG